MKVPWIRFGIEFLVLAALILTVLQQINAGLLAFAVYFFIYPFLALIVFIIIVVEIWILIKKRSLKRAQILSFLYIASYSTCLVIILVFHDSLIFFQEIVMFNLYRDRFDQIVTVVEQEPPCAETIDVLCDSFVRIPQDIGYWMPNSTVRVGKTGGNIFILVFSRNYVSFVYLADQTELPSFSGYHYGVTCDYRLSENWFICGAGT